MEFWRKYGVGFTVEIPVIKRGAADFALGTDWAPAAGDVKITKDGAAAANIGTLPAALAMGNTATWQFVVSATEAQAKRIAITVGDAAPKAVEDQHINIFTFGDPSAYIQPDLTAAQLPASLVQVNGDATAAGNLAHAARAIARGTATTGASATSIPTSAFSPSGAVADQFKGRVVVFDADTTTTTLRGVAVQITGSSNAALPTLTVATMPATPASGDTFSVV